MTLLEYAAIKGRYNMMKAILEKGVEPSGAVLGRIILERHAKRPDSALLELLIKSAPMEGYWELKECGGWDNIFLNHLCLDNNPIAVSAILNAKPVCLRVDGVERWVGSFGLLSAAAGLKDFAVCKKLIECSVSDDALKGVLDKALIYNNTEMIYALITVKTALVKDKTALLKGLNVLDSAKDHNLYVRLYEGLRYTHDEATNLLKNACEKGELKKIEFLLGKGVEPNLAVMIAAVNLKETPICEVLCQGFLKKVGESTDVCWPSDVLEAACRVNNYQIIGVLTGKGVLFTEEAKIKARQYAGLHLCLGLRKIVGSTPTSSHVYSSATAAGAPPNVTTFFDASGGVANPEKPDKSCAIL